MTTATNTLDQNTVLLVVRMGRVGNRRRVKTGAEGEVDVLPREDTTQTNGDGAPDQAAVHVAKELLNSPELRDIATLQAEVRHYIYSRALPNFHILKGSVHRLPIRLVPEVDAKLLEFAAQQDDLVENFVLVLPTRIAEARLRLRALFNPADYPSADQARESFRMSFRYLSTDIPQVLGLISQGLMNRERAKLVAEVAAEADEIKLAMRQSFADLIDHAAERLGTGPSGKKMIFKDSLVKNLEEFFALFSQRNVVGDQELAQLVERARQTMQGVTPDALRQGADLRAQIRDVFTNIKGEMTRNLFLRPTRMLILDEEVKHG